MSNPFLFLVENANDTSIPIISLDGNASLNDTNIPNDDFQVSPYVSTEYFYNLLPCYIFIITGIYRYITIYKSSSFKEKVLASQQENQIGETTTGEDSDHQHKIILSNYERDIEQLEEKTASYYIKTRISFANSILYIISVIFAFVMPASLFSAAIKPVEGLFYLFGMIAWYISGKLIKVEFEKGLNQELYTHRVFWVFTGSLALIRIFQKSERPLFNVIINSSRFLLIFFLMIYAIFKPYDREIEMGIVDDEMPTWARSFFDKFESNKFVAKLVGYNPKTENENEREMNPALNPEELEETREKFHQYINERRNSNFVQNVNQEQFLFKNLPKRRVVGLSKMPIKKRINTNETKVFYQIITQINQNQYISEKKYPEFLALEKELAEIYNLEDFPNLCDKVPTLEKVDLDELKDEQQFIARRIQFLEKFLQSIFHSPAFIHPKVLTFLEIAEEDKSSFLAYFSYISKGIYKNTRRMSRTLDEIQSGGKTKQRKSSLLEKKNNNANFEENRLEKAYKKNFIFDISCVDWQKGAFADYYEFIFSITNQTNYPFQTWRVSKTLSAIREFHTALENKTGNSIPFLTKFVPKNNNTDKNSLITRKEGLNKYIKELTANKNYYCDVFFDFIEFDPVREMPFSLIGNLSRKGSDFDEIGGGQNLEEEFYFTFEELPAQIDFPKKLEIKTKISDVKERKLVYDIDFNYAIIRVVGVKSSSRQNGELNSEGKLESIVHYYLNLEEFYEPNESEFRLRTVIRVKKRYDDFNNLYKNIWAIYRDIFDVNIPSLPAQKLVVHGVTKFDPKERKQTWETFFFNLLRIPRIEENESFKEFFNLNKLESASKYYRDEKEVHDFT